MKPLQLRHALSRHLGQVLTPEVAARIEAMALVNAMPVPEAPGGETTGEQRPEFFAFINAALGEAYEPGTSRVLARAFADGSPRCVVAYQRSGPAGVDMAVAAVDGPRWCTRHFLRWVFAYPFRQLGAARVTARIRASNAHAIRTDARLGFRHEGVLRRGFGNEDEVVMGMLASECRWIKGDFEC